MKRPMIVIGLSFFITLLLLNYLFGYYAFAVSIIGLAAFIIGLCVPRLRREKIFLTACVGILVSSLLFYGTYRLDYWPVTHCTGASVYVKAKVISVPGRENEYGKYVYLLKTEKIGYQSLERKIRFQTTNPLAVDYYDEIEFNGKVYLLGENNEESHRYYRSKRIYLGGSTYDAVRIRQCAKKTPYSLLLKQKDKIIRLIDQKIGGDNAGLLIGLLFGEKSYMSTDCVETMRKAGISHLTAVSGLHLNAWAMALFYLLKKLKVSDKKRSFLTAGVVLAVMAFSAFSTSVTRAGLMMLLYLLGVFIGRQSEGFNSLGFSAFCLMAVNPWIVGDVSFLLTVLSTAGVLSASTFVFPKLEEKLLKVTKGKDSKILKWLSESVIITLSAQLFILPVSICCFGTVNPYGVLTNILVSAPAMISMFGAGLFPLFSVVVFMEKGAVSILKITGSYVLWVAKTVSHIPGSSVKTDYTFIYVWLWLSIAAILLAVVLWKRKRYYIGIVCILSVVSLLISCLTYPIYDKKRVRVDIINVGQTIAVYLHYRDKGCFIGCGGEWFNPNTVEIAFDKANAQVLYFLLPGEMQKAMGSFQSVYKNNPNAVVYASRILYGVPTVSFPKHFSFTPFENVKIEGKVENGYFTVDIFSTTIIISFDKKCVLLDTGFQKDKTILIAQQGLRSIESGQQFGCCLIPGKRNSNTPNFVIPIEKKATIHIKQSGFTVKEEQQWLFWKKMA